MTKIDTSKIAVNVFGWPYVQGGARKGMWAATYDGRAFQFFSSVSAQAEIKFQREQLIKDAARCLEQGKVEWAK
jgi:hypothetical protein